MRHAIATVAVALQLPGAAWAVSENERPIPNTEIRAVSASSTADRLEEDRPVYRVSALVDGLHWSPWGEGALGEGVGESIRIDLGGTRYLTRIGVVNGNLRDRQAWRDHGRARRLTLRFSSGTRDFPMSDTMDIQHRDLGGLVVTDFVELRVEEVWEGGTGPLCLSEIVLYEAKDVLARRPQLRRDIPAAVADLRDSGRAEAALEALDRIGWPAIPWLARPARDPRPEVRRRVAVALGRTGAPAAAPALQAMYTAARERAVRAAALDALAVLRSNRAVPFLARVAETAEPEMARRALRGMVGLGHPRALIPFLRALIHGGEAEADIAIEHLEIYRTRALRPLLHHAAEKDPAERRRALWALARLRLPAAYTMVARRFVTEPEATALEIVRGLDAARTAEALEILTANAGDGRTRVRAAITSALGGYATPASAGLLERLLREDPEAVVREAAWGALPRAGRHGVAVLERLVREGTDEQAAEAFDRLVETANPKTLEALVRLIGDHRPARRRRAIQSVLSRPDGGPRVLLALVGHVGPSGRVAVRRHFVSQGRDALSVLLPAADHGRTAPRAVALRSLGQIGAAEGVEAVKKGLEAEPLAVRRAAVWAAARLPSVRYGEVLMRLLHASETDLASGAVEALGAARHAPAVPMLAELLADNDDRSIRIIWALGEIGGREAVEALRRTFQKKPPFRLVVVSAAGRIDGKEAAALLMEAIADSDRAVRMRAEGTLGRSSRRQARAAAARMRERTAVAW